MKEYLIKLVGFYYLLTVFVNRGKGDYFRLGHGTDAHARKPQLVEGLKGKKVIHVAVGALHCLAVTDQGQVRNCQNKTEMSCSGPLSLLEQSHELTYLSP